MLTGDNPPMKPGEKAGPTSNQDAAQSREPKPDNASAPTASGATADVTAFANRLRKNLAHWHEQENTRLKKLLAERDLAIEVMKEIAAKKW